MKKLLTIFAVLVLPVFAFAYETPSIDINGVAHYLVDEDETTGEVFDSADGYCVQKGLEYSSSSYSSPNISMGPLVALNATGKVLKTYKDNSAGNLWVVAGAECE